MGAGIALQFTRRYPLMKQELLSHQLKVTDVVFYKEKHKHSVFNLITKEMFYHKPTRRDFNETIINLKKVITDSSINKLAIPLLGAGLDKLNWNITSDFIKECFHDTALEILVVRLGGLNGE